MSFHHTWSHAITDRVTVLNSAAPRQPSQAKYVLCWLQQALRAWDNPAIDAAVELGNATALPVIVLCDIHTSYPYASDRLHYFLLCAGRALQQDCATRGLRCVTHTRQTTDDNSAVAKKLARQAFAIITDDVPRATSRERVQDFAAHCDTSIFAVDAARLVPTRKLQAGITTTPHFRKASGALRSTYEDHDCDFASNLPPYAGELAIDDHNLAIMSDAKIAKCIAAAAIDHSLPPSDTFEPTHAAATVMLSAFVTEALPTYPYRRNNAADEAAVSRLSPYLHFGLIGPRQITAAVRAADVAANAKWKYLDELLTWREYFHYLELHDPDFAAFTSVPYKARQSLLDHADDPRPVLYSLPDLVHGRTDDATWNAAQRQWLLTGYMHNNLRMYWAKQIIKWTRDPHTAWRTACYLNDRLSLDGRDPATCGNMRWVFGASKPAWREQPIYGWVPPKADRAIMKRDGAPAWIADWSQRNTPAVAVAEGMPHDIFAGA